MNGTLIKSQVPAFQ